MARVLGLGPRGREFESRIPEVSKKSLNCKYNGFNLKLIIYSLVSYQNDSAHLKIKVYVYSHVWRNSIFFKFTIEIRKEIYIHLQFDKKQSLILLNYI